jgi:hypothetical protein
MNLSLPTSLSYQEREEQPKYKDFKLLSFKERGWGEVKFKTK